jgi:hypothetical protein
LQSITAAIHSRPDSQSVTTACSEPLKPSLVAVAPTITASTSAAAFAHTIAIIATSIHSSSQNPIAACSELLKPSLVTVAPAIAAFAMFAVFAPTIIATTVRPSARNPAATTRSKLPSLHLIAAAAFTSRSPSHFSNEANSLVHAPQVFSFTLASISPTTFVNADLATAAINITTPAAHATVSAVLTPAVHTAYITTVASAVHTPSSSL